MYRFRYFLIEAKVDDFTNRYVKYHSTHPQVVSNPEQAKELIKHAHQFAQGHDESIFLTKHLLDGVYKPGEDDATIKSTLGKWRRAKTEGLVGGKLSDHTHESISAIFNDIPQLNLQKRQAQALGGMEKYRVGEIEHPKHGTLTVYQVRNKKIKDDKEYENISDSLRKTCSGSSWCVLPREHGPLHLKHYSHGPGIFFYVDKSGSPVLSHGFGDRGIVRPDNSVIGEKETESIINKTHKILPKGEQEGYDFFNRSKTLNSDPEYQSKMYDEFGDAHAASHFLDPKADTHPKIINRIIDDNIKNGRSGYSTEKLSETIVKHKNFSADNIDHILNLRYSDWNPNDLMEDPHKPITYLASMASRTINMSNKHIDRIFNSDDSKLMSNILYGSARVKKKHIKQAFNSKNLSVRREALQHHKADDEMLHQAIMDQDLGIISTATRSPKMKDEHFNKLFDRLENDPKLTKEAKDVLHGDIGHSINKGQVSKEIFQKAVNYSTDKTRHIHAPEIAGAALASEHINDKHIDEIDRHYPYHAELSGSLLHSGKAKSGILNAFVNHPTHDTLKQLSRNTGLNSEQYGKLINHLTKKDPHQYSPPFIADKSASNLLKNPSLSTENIRQLYNEIGLRDGNTPHELIRSERLPKDIYDKHFSHILQNTHDPRGLPSSSFDMDKHIRHMVQSPHFDSKHLDEVLDSPMLQEEPEDNGPGYTHETGLLTNSAIKTAIEKNKFNSNHLQKVFDIKGYEGKTNPHALGAVTELVNKTRDPNFKHDPKMIAMVKSHPDKLISDHHVFLDKDFNSEKLHKILQSGSTTMAMKGLVHHLVTPDHYTSALRNPDENVRKLAQIQLDVHNESKIDESIFVAARRILYT